MWQARAVIAALCMLVSAWPQVGMAQAPAPAGAGPSLTGLLDRLEQERQGWLETAGTPAGARVAVPAKPLRKGSRGPDIALLCRALEARGLSPCTPGQEVVDAALADRIATAQRFYGLAADGLADSQLYNALALSGEERAARIAALAQQWQELRERAQAIGASKYIVVSIASFEARAVAADSVAISTRLIVGRPSRPTPVGMMNVVALKFNPDWTPPPTILKQDIYPNLAKGGDWIRAHGLVLLDKAGAEVDWEGLTPEEIRQAGYRFVQRPGDAAALGRLKFETDSPQNIYLHDTNERPLFARAMRAQSSGCIRVERWREMAAWVSESDLTAIDRKVATRKTFFEATAKVPVFVIYQLADLHDGRVVFYPDIYQRGEPKPADD